MRRKITCHIKFDFLYIHTHVFMYAPRIFIVKIILPFVRQIQLNKSFLMYEQTSSFVIYLDTSTVLMKINTFLKKILIYEHIWNVDKLTFFTEFKAKPPTLQDYDISITLYELCDYQIIKSIFVSVNRFSITRTPIYFCFQIHRIFELFPETRQRIDIHMDVRHNQRRRPKKANRTALRRMAHDLQPNVGGRNEGRY